MSFLGTMFLLVRNLTVLLLTSKRIYFGEQFQRKNLQVKPSFYNLFVFCLEIPTCNSGHHTFPGHFLINLKFSLPVCCFVCLYFMCVCVFVLQRGLVKDTLQEWTPRHHTFSGHFLLNLNELGTKESVAKHCLVCFSLANIATHLHWATKPLTCTWQKHHLHIHLHWATKALRHLHWATTPLTNLHQVTKPLTHNCTGQQNLTYTCTG